MELLITIFLSTQQPKTPPPPQDGTGGIITALLTFAGGYLSTQKKESNQETKDVTVNISQPTSTTEAIDKSTPELTTSNYSWLDKVLKLPFRIISGKQGSGKSTLERFMIAKLVESGWHVIIVNPETNPKVWHGVEVLAEVDEINQFFKDFLQWVRDRSLEARDNNIDEDDYYDRVKIRSGRDGLVAVFLMETNTYEAHGVDSDAWANFLKQCLTNIRKWGFTGCFTAHSDNQTSVASKLKGFSDLLSEQPRIDCIAITDPHSGEATSSGEGWLKLQGVKDRNPIKISLYNYPKTKDFRKTNERNTRADTISDSDNIDITTTTSIDSGSVDSKPPEHKQQSELEALADKVYVLYKGKGRNKISRLPTESKPVRKWLIDKFGRQDLDDINQIKELHIIVGLLVYQGRAVVYGNIDKLGLIVLSKDSEFETI